MGLEDLSEPQRDVMALASAAGIVLIASTIAVDDDDRPFFEAAADILNMLGGDDRLFGAIERLSKLVGVDPESLIARSPAEWVAR